MHDSWVKNQGASRDYILSVQALEVNGSYFFQFLEITHFPWHVALWLHLQSQKHSISKSSPFFRL